MGARGKTGPVEEVVVGTALEAPLSRALETVAEYGRAEGTLSCCSIAIIPTGAVDHTASVAKIAVYTGEAGSGIAAGATGVQTLLTAATAVYHLSEKTRGGAGRRALSRVEAASLAGRAGVDRSACQALNRAGDAGEGCLVLVVVLRADRQAGPVEQVVEGTRKAGNTARATVAGRQALQTGPTAGVVPGRTAG